MHNMGIVFVGIYKDNNRYNPDTDATDGYMPKVMYTNEVDRGRFFNRELVGFNPSKSQLTVPLNDKFFHEEGVYRKYMVSTNAKHAAHLFRPPKIHREKYRGSQKHLEEYLKIYNELEIN